MVDKEGIDVFFHKAVLPCSPSLFYFYFFCHNISIAGASSVAMETNVESQLWFCLRGPLAWSTALLSFLLFFHGLGLAAANISFVCSIQHGSDNGCKLQLQIILTTAAKLPPRGGGNGKARMERVS